jgi:hypothetical protein
MDAYELRRQVRAYSEHLRQLEIRYRNLKRRQFLHRGNISPFQASELRTILRGHSIDARHLVDFEPSDCFTKDGDLDVPRVLWLLDSIGGEYLG